MLEFNSGAIGIDLLNIEAEEKEKEVERLCQSSMVCTVGGASG